MPYRSAIPRAAALCSSLVFLGAFAASAQAQWLEYPTPGIPRTADGAADLSAETPLLANGKPDLSGLWENDNPGRYLGNLAADLDDGAPLRPWARALLEERIERRGVDDPNAYCLPSGIVAKHAVPAPFKIIQRPELLVILYESRTTYRQILTDGRPLPDDPQPSWHGYSVGHWEGDTLVVESSGFNGKFWLDVRGLPASEELRVVERFTRPTFGELVVEITIDDPKAYEETWSVTQSMSYLPDTDLIEHVCEENNRFLEQLPSEAIAE